MCKVVPTALCTKIIIIHHHSPSPGTALSYVLLSQTLAARRRRAPTAFVRLASDIKGWCDTATKCVKPPYYPSVGCSAATHARIDECDLLFLRTRCWFFKDNLHKSTVVLSNVLDILHLKHTSSKLTPHVLLAEYVFGFLFIRNE